jgi:hypothetical protein
MSGVQVRRRHYEAASAFVAVIGRYSMHQFCVLHDALGNRNKGTTRIRDADHSISPTYKDGDAQFLFEFEDLFANTRLRGVKCFCRG